jgi:hypothetical protein
VAAAPFDVVGVHGAPAGGGNRVGQRPRFVERIGVQGDGHVVLVGDRQATVDDGGIGAEILVDLETGCAPLHRPVQRSGVDCRASGEERHVHRDGPPALEQAGQVHRRIDAHIPHPAHAHAHDGGGAGRQRHLGQSRRGQMDV